MLNISDGIPVQAVVGTVVMGLVESLPTGSWVTGSTTFFEQAERTSKKTMVTFHRVGFWTLFKIKLCTNKANACRLKPNTLIPKNRQRSTICRQPLKFLSHNLIRFPVN